MKTTDVRAANLELDSWIGAVARINALCWLTPISTHHYHSFVLNQRCIDRKCAMRDMLEGNIASLEHFICSSSCTSKEQVVVARSMISQYKTMMENLDDQIERLSLGLSNQRNLALDVD